MEHAGHPGPLPPPAQREIDLDPDRKPTTRRQPRHPGLCGRRASGTDSNVAGLPICRLGRMLAQVAGMRPAIAPRSAPGAIKAKTFSGKRGTAAGAHCPAAVRPHRCGFGPAGREHAPLSNVVNTVASPYGVSAVMDGGRA
ncbi:MAG: hypothetical protein V8S34_02290 [Lawsonibacter sp.]